ncbi:MAG: hypothetical protein KAS77_14010, partial [Thermoplasmata archaeon]|nr:hypothetical protein [Thermoplasmata archaeon]
MAALSPLLSDGPDLQDSPSPASKEGATSGGSIGPAADTDPPSFVGFTRSPDYPGPTTKVNLEVKVTDASYPVNVSLKYGYDNSTWTNLTTTKQSTGISSTIYNRNPTSGYIRIGTLTRTYDLGGKHLWYLYVYCYTSDGDTVDVKIRGFDSISQKWDTLFSQHTVRPGSGAKINEYFKDKSYTKWDMSYYDYENDGDSIYYYCNYQVIDPVTFEVPAAGDNAKVYARFNATDPSNNTMIYVYEYRIDLKAPVLKDVSTFNYTIRSPNPITIIASLTDNRRVGRCFINWSLDETNWFWSEMSKFTGTDTNRQMKGSLPPPYINKNMTVYYRIEAFDEGGNHGNSSTYNLTWNPPPWISNLSWTPYYVDNLTK